jgi:hypothetical protein
MKWLTALFGIREKFFSVTYDADGNVVKMELRGYSSADAAMIVGRLRQQPAPLWQAPTPK